MFEIKLNFTYPTDNIGKLLPSIQANNLESGEIWWSGMNTYATFTDIDSERTIFAALPTGHTFDQPYLLVTDQTNVSVYPRTENWVCQSLLKLSRTSSDRPIKISKEVFKTCREVIILNCIDFLYGHSLLKLLNAQRHLAQDTQYGLVVLIPKIFRWLVPEGVAEIWTVDIPLRDGEKHYPKFNTAINKELERFDRVLLSEAYAHPSYFDISTFTGVDRHCFSSEDFRITFVWREDRLWVPAIFRRILNKLSLSGLALKWQNARV